MTSVPATAEVPARIPASASAIWFKYFFHFLSPIFKKSKLLFDYIPL